jgi:hypothetical protein
VPDWILEDIGMPQFDVNCLVKAAELGGETEAA